MSENEPPAELAQALSGIRHRLGLHTKLLSVTCVVSIIILVAVVLLLPILSRSRYSIGSVGPTMATKRLSNPESITVLLTPSSRAERLAAARMVLNSIGAAADVDSLGMFETGLVTVEVDIGTSKAAVYFHIAWPDPTLDSLSLGELRLVSWTVDGASNSTSATVAREQARLRLLELLQAASASGTELEGSVIVVESPDAGGG